MLIPFMLKRSALASRARITVLLTAVSIAFGTLGDQANAQDKYQITAFTREADDMKSSYAIVQHGLPLEVAVCTFHGIQSWHKNHVTHLVTHGTIGIANNGESTFADIAVFGFPKDDISHPVVAVIQRIHGRDTEIDVDLRWEQPDTLGELRSVTKFACGLLRVRPSPGATVWSDSEIASLYHAVSWGRPRQEIVVPLSAPAK